MSLPLPGTGTKIKSRMNQNNGYMDVCKYCVFKERQLQYIQKNTAVDYDRAVSQV